MRRFLIAGGLAAMLTGVVVHAAQEGSSMPAPQQEHGWLQQIVGEWDGEAEATMDPAQPPQKFKLAESGRMIGGFWAMLENKGELAGDPFTGILSLGYDPAKKKYVGTWFDSKSSYLWHYLGTVDPSGKILTLETEGPSFDVPGKFANYRESIEVKSKDHKVFTSSMEKDGKWLTFLTIHYRRKK